MIWPEPLNKNTKKLLLAMLPKWIALCILIYLIIWALK